MKEHEAAITKCLAPTTKLACMYGCMYGYVWPQFDKYARSAFSAQYDARCGP